MDIKEQQAKNEAVIQMQIMGATRLQGKIVEMIGDLDGRTFPGKGKIVEMVKAIPVEGFIRG